jgi:solute carrier family 25 phosphate transporter 23/24/25/41
MSRSSTSTSSQIHSISAGAFAGCVTRFCTSPLDVLKILFQVNAMPVPHALAQSSVSIHRVCRNLYRSEGLRGFWKGNLAGCCRLGPYSGVKFFIFDSLQSQFQTDKPNTAQRAFFGAVAGMIATVSVYPMEVVRTHMIIQPSRGKKNFSGIHGGLRWIYRKEGLRGLYRGGLSGLVGSIPFEGIQFACYEYGKSYTVQQRFPAWRWQEPQKTELNVLDHMMIGSLSGICAQTVSYPFDSVKKRLQAQTLYGVSVSEQQRRYYHGMMDCFQKVIREEGPLALYRGTIPNTLRIVPYSAVMFTSYEAAKKFLSG